MLRKIILSTVLLSPLVFGVDASELNALKKDMPQDVAVLLDRIIQCNRWQGEDTSTKARADKVNKELEKWQCNAIAKDQDAITKLYKNNYQVKKRIEEAQYILW